ncbi:MAG TPA: Type 1 glutamine amidotransferase-like domain-containing protein [Thermoanaerobaculia bacterium]|nr:Type 1 glutamine amidotransferase-like domain-containing protein [Thermoanaerobaculia bacterium]
MEAHPNRTVTLLGPQRARQTVAHAVRGGGVEGDVAVVTAGWQEREEEVDELSEHLGGGVVNLRLYARAEEVFRKDRALARAHRQRQDRLQRMQELYRLRLDHAMEAARLMLTRRGDPEVLDPEREASVAAIRELDRVHLERVRAVNAELDAALKPQQRPAVARHREELAKLLAGCSAFAVAGGHVALLLNRLRLFGIAEMIAGKPVFAWSGGAMVLGERLVLFHDHPPQGAGNAEVLEAGLGLFTGLLPLPHAKRRLKLDDRLRVALFARRFADVACVAMDDGAILRWQDGSWAPSGGDGSRRLLPDGGVEELAACIRAQH